MKRFPYLLIFVAIVCQACNLEEISDNVAAEEDLPMIVDFIPKMARSGDIITIEGKNFGTDEANILVQFNGVDASLSSAPTDEELKLIVPMGAGGGEIAVTESGNKVLGEGFTYLLSGQVITFAGTGIAGDVDGNRIGIAQLAGPEDLAIAPSGDIYFTDSGNHKIKKITPEGLTYDLAADETFGSDNGPGLKAKISGPFGIVLDTDRNVYVASYGNDNSRKIEVF